MRWNTPPHKFHFTNLTPTIDKEPLKTYDEAKKLIDEYIYFYNNQRIQLKTKLTPLELRCQYAG